MNWFRRHKIFTATAGVVLALCLLILGSFLLGGGSTLLGRALQTVGAAIEKPLSSAASGIRDTFTGIFNYRDVLEENEALKKENDALRQENLELELSREELGELAALAGAFDFTPFTGAGEAIAGRIISLDNSNLFHTFVIDAGSAKGIAVDDIVVNGSGLIGRVRETGENWAKVVSILDENNNVSFKVLRKGSILGVLHGDGEGGLTGYLLDGDAQIAVGDVLVTSGVGLYPQGIRIGKVATVSFNKDLQLRVVTVKPSVSFESMELVAVFP